MDHARIAALVARTTTAGVSDALRARHPHRHHLTGLGVARPGTVLAGWARTLQFLPTRDDRPGLDFLDLARAAIGDADPAGSVLVVATAGHPDEAVAGSRKLARLEVMGVAGMLADGRIRDLAEVGGFRMGVACRGETPRASGERVSPALADVEVDLGGVRVVPGDLVVADAAGAVVVPAGCAREVLEEAVRIEARDAAEVARVLGG
jgi:regulator of RNase E activity RraA